MTLGTVVIGCIAIFATQYTNNRRLGADIFLKYSDRISELRRRLPTVAILESDESHVAEITQEERRVAHEIIYAIFELFELRVHGYFPSTIWKIREPDVEALLSLPVFRQVMKALRGAFARHPRFSTWVDGVTRASSFQSELR
ncbi:hypothetical protein [Bradyrhizobium ganzhouense]|uniref:hypothetical protein n=1 Tax=Bradyrhizobium ganzhouense TaxID=1179767 RepID=UPI003CF3F135